jgi:hypothetical protein
MLQIRELGKGNFGVANLMKDKASGEKVAVKYLARGPKVHCDAMLVIPCIAS